MRSPEVSQRSGCPELETLAAFVEERLEAAEQMAVLEHLDACDACREVVAESRALLAEAEPAPREAARTLPFPEARARGGSRWVWSVAAGLALASAGLVYFLVGRSPSVDSVMAKFVRGAEATRLPADWTDPHWPVMRGAEAAFADRALAFRLGVRQADLALAIALGDRTRIEALATECAATLTSAPFAEEIAARYRELARRASEGAIERRSFEKVAALAAREAREAVDESALDLGVWAEAERLLASAGSNVRGPSPPALSSLPSRWSELARTALAALSASDLPAREAAFERLIAFAGDQQ